MLVRFTLLPWVNKLIPLWRRKIPFAFVITSAIWLVVLWISGQFFHALPWVCTFAAVGGVALVNMPGCKSVDVYQDKAKNGEWCPISLAESSAGTYVVWSLLLLGIVLMSCLYVSKNYQQRRFVEQQVVDIQLVDTRDFAFNHKLLSETIPKPNLRKSPSTDKMSFPGKMQMVTAGVQGNAGGHSINKNSLAQAVKVSQPGEKQKTVQKQQSKDIAVASANLPDSGSFFLVNHQQEAMPKTQVSKPQTVSRQTHFMEEVGPPEMIELVDNAGDQSFDVWQPGGHTSGGKGARTPLMDYLKELNKRIKQAWLPVGRNDSEAEILFRIEKSGKLASVKLIGTSGNPELDKSVIESVVTCSPFRPLPKDFPANFLDVRYTFNFKVDGLCEVKRQTFD